MKVKAIVGAIMILCLFSGGIAHAMEQKTVGKGNVEGLVNLMNRDISYLEKELNSAYKTRIAVADNASRRNNIKSKGKIDFEEGKMVLDSADLLYLADEIDALETTYKVTIIDALNRIGTYFKNDGNLTNDSNANEADTVEEKTNISFENIRDGVLLSQSVESLSNVQAEDKDGNNLFYLNEEVAANRNLLETTTENTGYPVFYQAVTADNLTAGSAAWVNGRLIKGNGKDRDDAYTQGFIDGQANVTDNLEITYTYHYHEGDAVNGGGCYEKVASSKACGNIVRLQEYYKGGTCGYTCASYYGIDYGCSVCGAVTGWKCGGGGNSCGAANGQLSGTHVVITTSWQPTCGYSQGQILTATIVY